MKTEGIDRKWLGEFEFQVFLNTFVWFRRSFFIAKKWKTKTSGCRAGEVVVSPSPFTRLFFVLPVQIYLNVGHKPWLHFNIGCVLVIFLYWCLKRALTLPFIWFLSAAIKLISQSHAAMSCVSGREISFIFFALKLLPKLQRVERIYFLFSILTKPLSFFLHFYFIHVILVLLFYTSHFFQTLFFSPFKPSL